MSQKKPKIAKAKRSPTIDLKKFLDWEDRIQKTEKRAKEVEDNFQKLSLAVGSEFAKVWANQQAMAEAMDAHDLNIMALDSVLKEVFLTLTQIRYLLEDSPGILADKMEELKGRSEEWYKRVVHTGFRRVQKEREEAHRLREEAMEKLKAEQARALDIQKEAERMEAEFRKTETEKSVEGALQGGPGSDVPEGTEIFGG